MYYICSYYVCNYFKVYLISGEGNGRPLQYSSLENPTDRGAYRATVCGVAESDTTEQLTYTQTFY